MHKRTANLIIVNDRNEVLLQLRDDKPTIPYPNTWTIPGGHIEHGETPEECIRREMLEEMALELKSLHPWITKEYPGETEIFFWTDMTVDVTQIYLSEGQAIRWFSQIQSCAMRLAHHDSEVLAAFWSERGHSVTR